MYGEPQRYVEKKRKSSSFRYVFCISLSLSQLRKNDDVTPNKYSITVKWKRGHTQTKLIYFFGVLLLHLYYLCTISWVMEIFPSCWRWARSLAVSRSSRWRWRFSLRGQVREFQWKRCSCIVWCSSFDCVRFLCTRGIFLSTEAEIGCIKRSKH